MDRATVRENGKRVPVMLPAPEGVRERLAAFYRERDAMDASQHAAGTRRMRGTIYALGAEKLESGEEVYESYGVVSAAGVELPQQALTLISGLPQDWRTVCRIDTEGNLWTASLREKSRRIR